MLRTAGRGEEGRKKGSSLSHFVEENEGSWKVGKKKRKVDTGLLVLMVMRFQKDASERGMSSILMSTLGRLTSTSVHEALLP